MIPDLPNLSTPALQAEFKQPHNRGKSPLVDYARGGVALLDASKGLNVKNWICEANEDGVFISSQGASPTRIETLPGRIEWISMAFDQNMHYNLAYVIRGAGSFLYWYNAAKNQYVTEPLGDVKTPILRMDDVRDEAINDCSMVLSYIKSSILCVRIQNDRFGVEYELANAAGKSIWQCGMNVGMRFQWSCV